MEIPLQGGRENDTKIFDVMFDGNVRVNDIMIAASKLTEMIMDMKTLIEIKW